MSTYDCKCCNFSTKLKSNYTRHLKTNKHKNVIQSYPKLSKCYPNVIQSYPNNKLVSEKQHRCKYCDKTYKYRSGLSKHIKYTCKKNKDEDFQELARLLNEKERQLVLKETKMEIEMKKMQRQIDKLTSKLQIQNINQGFVQNGNNVINIQLLNHKDTDYSHLTANDYMSCIADCNKCVKTLIEKVHFNSNKPENMNIYLSNIKGKYLMIYKGNTWQIQDKKTQVDDLYDSNEFVLETWYDEYKEKYPSIIASFQKYLQNRDENEVLNSIKEEILVMLYNNRKMVAIEN
jgi:hypothetical protein